jgi:hypothetical protein
MYRNSRMDLPLPLVYSPIYRLSAALAALHSLSLACPCQGLGGSATKYILTHQL